MNITMLYEELQAALETAEKLQAEIDAYLAVEEENPVLKIDIMGHLCEYEHAQKENGVLRYAQTAAGERIPLYIVTKEPNCAFGERQSAPVVLNGVQKEMPLSLVGALFTIQKGVALEIRNQPWRENYHPYAYTRNAHSVLADYDETLKELLGTIPDAAPEVTTGRKKAVKH